MTSPNDHAMGSIADECILQVEEFATLRFDPVNELEDSGTRGYWQGRIDGAAIILSLITGTIFNEADFDDLDGVNRFIALIKQGRPRCAGSGKEPVA